MLTALAAAALSITCTNPAALALHDAGFRGDDLRTAWAIVMRESGGRPDAISATGDYGMAQLNKATWQHASWWDTDQMLQRGPNARAMYRVAEGGKTFRAWGLDGQGNRHPASPYSSSIDSKFREWRAKFPKGCE